MKTKRGRKLIYYYYVWDEYGKRHKYSTGLSDEEQARDYCVALKKANQLIPKAGCQTKPKFIEPKLLFKNFADGFWNIETSKYLEERTEQGHTLTKGTLMTRIQRTKDYIMPDFGEMPLTAITKKQVKEWLLRLGKKKGHHMANSCLGFLSTILNYAVSEEILDLNPCKSVKPLAYKAKKKDFFSFYETIMIFHYYNRVRFGTI